MQHPDDVLDHLSRLQGHLEPCVEGVYGLVTETLRREGGKVSIRLENNLIISASYSSIVYSLRGISVRKMSNLHYRSTPVNSNQGPKTPHPQERVNPCSVASYVPTS